MSLFPCPFCRTHVACTDPEVFGAMECGICHEDITRMTVLRPCGHMVCSTCCSKLRDHALSDDDLGYSTEEEGDGDWMAELTIEEKLALCVETEVTGLQSSINEVKALVTAVRTWPDFAVARHWTTELGRVTQYAMCALRPSECAHTPGLSLR